ncbi:Protein conserved in bacteria [Magnetospirillum sp. LM-5]|uniref:L,D-transpeptidase family protein n=1 Tax=Magnetospirillum sp. LM-5 TaxID=2681466 RepID=UPI001381851A|nr:L,D-transpeptidase family protein [Magnetospirillum sp. LM-5]CAA7622724.1 Protein conserved in bacteria [Magnetospirillum sp. LM-5]
MMRIDVGADGWLSWNGRRIACRLGRSGIIVDKREGDGATPVGAWPLRRALYRPDRLARPVTGLEVAEIGPADGWCDDSAHPDYNRSVELPHPARCEKMWRDDHLYDVVVVLGHNDDPPVAGRGSAIFLHVADPEGKPTEGCVAIDLADLLDLLADCRPGDLLVVSAL